jgi:hypothetical protein
MIYIPFPRKEHNNDPDLRGFLAKSPKKKGDWTSLKDYLQRQSLFPPGSNNHPLPKCWYSEMPQGDNYALDVEHFRPKASGEPLSKKIKQKIEKQWGVQIPQLETAGSYPWLEFDYRNYRLVTALTNRAGAKHTYFPVLQGRPRLPPDQLPWKTKEYSLLLDPADPHDAKQLLVLPQGKIVPRAKNIPLTQADYDNLPHSWYNEGFYYLRACVTIALYRLDEKVFAQGRAVKFKATQEAVTMLLEAYKSNNPTFIKHFTRQLFYSLLPSAEFALAARCAMEAYVPATNESPAIKVQLADALRDIIHRVDDLVSKVEVDWESVLP